MNPIENFFAYLIAAIGFVIVGTFALAVFFLMYFWWVFVVIGIVLLLT